VDLSGFFKLEQLPDNLKIRSIGHVPARHALATQVAAARIPAVNLVGANSAFGRGKRREDGEVRSFRGAGGSGGRPSGSGIAGANCAGSSGAVCGGDLSGQPGKIAYSAYDGTNEATYTIGVSGGGHSSKVVDNASEPSYSPSSKKIAYLGGTPANPAIYTIGVGGAGEVKVSDTGVADFEPSWGVSSTPQSP
jgi:hypothetical protein